MKILDYAHYYDIPLCGIVEIQTVPTLFLAEVDEFEDWETRLPQGQPSKLTALLEVSPSLIEQMVKDYAYIHTQFQTWREQWKAGGDLLHPLDCDSDYQDAFQRIDAVFGNYEGKRQSWFGGIRCLGEYWEFTPVEEVTTSASTPPDPQSPLPSSAA